MCGAGSSAAEPDGCPWVHPSTTAWQSEKTVIRAPGSCWATAAKTSANAMASPKYAVWCSPGTTPLRAMTGSPPTV
eukprot:12913232-Prorocentrum_lima.AAC.1